METPKVFIDLAVALGVGLLVGLQRERAGSAIAGIRTFPLISLGGAVAASLPDQAGVWAVAAGVIAVGVLCWIGNFTRPPEEKSPGVTTEAAMVLVFLVGAQIVWGPRAAGVAVGAAAAVLLHSKPFLQKFTQRLGEHDLQAIMQFAVISLIILPVLPNEALDPLGVLNPRRIWMLVVLMVGISLVGYIAYRLLGDRQGALIAGALGGLISSTATTASFSRRARDDPQSASIAALAILVASTVLGGRLLVVLWITVPEQWARLAPPIGILIAAGAICTGIRRILLDDGETPPQNQQNPTQLKAALFFAALFAAVLFASALAHRHFGQSGTYVVAVLSGLTDMDAISLSIGSQMSQGTVDAATGLRGILLAFISNTAFKTGMAGVLGGGRLFVRLAPFMAAQILVAAALMAWWPGIGS